MSKRMDPPTPGRTGPLPGKLTPPRLPKIVPRARLFRELDRARTRPIIWITGPPGAGKTTLVASYLKVRRLRPLWYTVDERDEDLTPEYLQGLSVFTRNVFEALDAQLPRSVALVLDNYQTISTDSPVHEMLALGLSHLVVERPVLIISREEPPPAWASLLVSRRMTRFDGHTLRLTSAESLAIIALYRSRRRDAAVEKALAEAVATLDGWMAGMVLLLEEATGSSTTLASQKPSRQALFNYLGSEVFVRMDVSTQEVLLSTAYYPVVTGAMATELSRHRDADAWRHSIGGATLSNGMMELRRPTPITPCFRNFSSIDSNSTGRQIELPPCVPRPHISLLRLVRSKQRSICRSTHKTTRPWLTPSSLMLRVSCVKAALR